MPLIPQMFQREQIYVHSIHMFEIKKLEKAVLRFVNAGYEVDPESYRCARYAASRGPRTHTAASHATLTHCCPSPCHVSYGTRRLLGCIRARGAVFCCCALLDSTATANKLLVTCFYAPVVLVVVLVALSQGI